MLQQPDGNETPHFEDLVGSYDPNRLQEAWCIMGVQRVHSPHPRPRFMGRLLVIKCVVVSPGSRFKNRCGQNLGGVLGVGGRARSAAEVPLSKVFNSQMLTSPIYSWDMLSILLLTPTGIKKSGKC